MTTYQDYCKALLDEAPRREAIDRMLRVLPVKMAQAISDYLAAPDGCVGLYQCVVDAEGHRTWQRCQAADCLQADYNGIYQFCVGIDTYVPAGSSNYSIGYLLFTVEEFDERSIELQINNLDGKISITDANDPARYVDAAKTAIDLIMSDLKNPKPLRGSRAPIGFGHHGS